MRLEVGLINSKISPGGLLVVLVLHGIAIYGLWSYRFIPAPDEAITLMVNLINSPSPEQPKVTRPKPKMPPKPKPVELPKPRQLVAEKPVVLQDEPQITALAPEPIIETPPLPPQPVQLANELSVSCPERIPPKYPLISKRRNEQGRVVLQIVLDEEGRVELVEIKSPSGFTRLDTAAVNAVKKWRCKPAMQNNVAVPAIALQPFVFILEGR